MRAQVWIAGLVAALPLACVLHSPPAEIPKKQVAAAASERDVDALLERALQAHDAERYAEARDLARKGRELTATVHVAPRTLAMLHETEGAALLALAIDFDARERLEAALELWENIPGAERDVARVCRRVAITLAFPVVELDRAEQLLRRSIELAKKYNPTDTSELLGAHFVLLDVLDQECRSADARPLIEAAEALVNTRQPKRRMDAQGLCRVRSQFAENEGDLDAAIEWERRGLDELASLRSSDDVLQLRRVIFERMASLERGRGNYAAALELVEKEIAIASEGAPGASEEHAGTLHLAYVAARDPRLAEHDRKHELFSARAGVALFPAELPKTGACHPEPPGRRLGKLNRYRAVSELSEYCLKDRSARSRGQSINVAFRLVEGKAVAVEAVGRLADPEVLRCVLNAVLSFEHPTDKYNEFESMTLH
jgi:tetratricopeptide (TPR) repeat protein